MKVTRYYSKILSGVYQRFFIKRILLNVNREKSKKNKKRALLVYLTAPFKTDAESETFKSHTNFWRNIEIAKILGEFGYIVDVINYNDCTVKLRRDYDLVMGLGNALEKRINELPKKTIKIYLATGSEANFFNKKMEERFKDLNRKKGCSLKVSRTNEDNSEILKDFDSLICLGNEVTAGTYKPYFKKKIYCFNNHGYDKIAVLPKNKEYEKTRKNFLFLSGTGKSLNGLDLLLEIFKKRPSLNLYVCGSFKNEEDFEECFKKELYETSNIHTVGWVGVGSKRYTELIKKCGIVIVPICAGASHGSVVVCMNNGIIPVVTKEAGIDTEDFGVTLKSYSIKDIEKTVDWISNQSADWHKKMAERTYKKAREKFSQTAFTRRWREILGGIISTNKNAFNNS